MRGAVAAGHTWKVMQRTVIEAVREFNGGSPPSCTRPTIRDSRVRTIRRRAAPVTVRMFRGSNGIRVRRPVTGGHRRVLIPRGRPSGCPLPRRRERILRRFRPLRQGSRCRRDRLVGRISNSHNLVRREQGVVGGPGRSGSRRAAVICRRVVRRSRRVLLGASGRIWLGHRVVPCRARSRGRLRGRFRHGRPRRGSSRRREVVCPAGSRVAVGLGTRILLGCRVVR